MNVGGVHTSTVQAAHAYTRTDVPWELDANRTAYGETSKGRRFGWRLFHYISSGGMRTFGRTVGQMQSERRQRRFMVFVAAFWVVWAILYFI